MPNYLTSRLAAHLDTAQATTYAQIGRIEASVDRFVHGIWAAIQRGIQGDRHHVKNQIQVVLNALPALHLVVNEGLYRAAFVASEQAQDTLLKTLPVSVLSLATEGRGRRKRLTESLRRNLTESVATPGQQREIRNLLFDPMQADKAQRIVYGTTKGLTWDQRLSAMTRLADAQTLAPIIDDWARGELPPRELERRLLPVLEGVRTSARRVARTEAARVATEARFEEYEQLGEVVIGYQVFGTMDARIRPHHAARNGNIYYRRPQPGQLSMDEMPRPPIEEDGTVAHNCRCWIVPVVGVQSQIENDPAAKKLFTDAKGSLVPDPSVYHDWFANASEEERAEVVGQRRYALMMDKLQARPNWGHFLDPKTGRLMSLRSLERETPERQRVRMARVNEVLNKRRELAEKVRNYGYVPPDSEAASKIKAKDRLLPAKYVSTHLDKWMKQSEFKDARAMRAAIKADAGKPEFVRRITYGVTNGSFRGYLTDQGQPLDTREAAKAMAQVQYLARGAKPESKPRRTVIGLPPGTAARIRAKPNAPFRLASMAPIGKDVFDPIARGLEQVEVVIEPGTPIIRMGADRYLPPGEYAILAVTPTDIRIRSK